EDDITWPQDQVLGAALDDRRQRDLEGHGLVAAAGAAGQLDAAGRGVGGEAAGERDGLDEGEAVAPAERAGVVDLAEHADLAVAPLLDLDDDVRVVEVAVGEL